MSPPFVFLTSVKSELRPEIQVAAQNCWVKKGGAFTGEVRYVSLHHSLSIISLLYRKCIESLFKLGMIAT